MTHHEAQGTHDSHDSHETHDQLADAPIDPLSDFSLPGDTDLHVEGDATGADGDEVAEPTAKD